MSRKIKFRAWDKTEKEILNDISLQNDTWDMMNEFFRNTDDLVFIQYTGLTDKNGMEIYEGNYVRCFREQENLVYDPETFAVIDNHIETIDVEGVVSFANGAFVINDEWEIGWFKTDELEVLGNIYENPELLEEEAE